MPLFPVAASGAWPPEFPRSSPGTRDKTASGFDKRGGRGPSHPAPGRAIPELLRVAVALRPHKKNTICSPPPPDRESQISNPYPQICNETKAGQALSPVHSDSVFQGCFGTRMRARTGMKNTRPPSGQSFGFAAGLIVGPKGRGSKRRYSQSSPATVWKTPQLRFGLSVRS